MSPTTEVCLVARTYKPEWDDFFRGFSYYNPRMCIDDMSTYTEPETRDDFIPVTREECAENGFRHSSTVANFPEIIAWDKALCYYITHENQADYVWFMEDDVFFTSEETLKNIDAQYPDEDLLTVFHEVNESGELYGWNHWVNARGRIDTPWAHSMICACRISRRLLQEVGEYVKQRGELFFIEIMFNTLAHQKGLKLANPPEMSNIHWLTEWDRDTVDPTKIYHPFKKMEDHVYMRGRHKNHEIS